MGEARLRGAQFFGARRSAGPRCRQSGLGLVLRLLTRLRLLDPGIGHPLNPGAEYHQEKTAQSHEQRGSRCPSLWLIAVIDGATHTDLILDEEAAAATSQAILDVVSSVRSGGKVGR